MIFTWHYCEDGTNLPPLNKSKVCVFKRGTRTYMKTCALVEDPFYPSSPFWILKGAVEAKAVYPFAWLEIEEDFPEQFFIMLRSEKSLKISYFDYHSR